MCFGSDKPKETDEEEAARLDAAQKELDAANRARADAEARRAARVQAEAERAAGRKAMANAEERQGDDTSMTEEELKKKQAGKGISSLRINKASSLGGAPIGAGLTVA